LKYRYSFCAYVVAFIVQSTLLHDVSFFGVAPNLILILTIVFSFLFNEKHGIIFGVIFGLLSDLSFSEVIGISALCYFLIALSIEGLKKFIYRDNVISVIFISAFGTLLYNILYWGISGVFGGNIDFVYMLFKQPVSIVYNSILVLPIYWFLVRKVIRYRGFKYM